MHYSLMGNMRLPLQTVISYIEVPYKAGLIVYHYTRIWQVQIGYSISPIHILCTSAHLVPNFVNLLFNLEG